MKKLIQNLLLLLMTTITIAQTELKENQFEGYIITNDGKKVEGIVEINNIKYPWSFQESILFFDKSLLEDNEKVKRKEKSKYKPGDITEYGFGDKRFVSISYNDNNTLDNNDVNETLGMIKSVTKTKYFAEVYYSGNISIYRFYSSPTGFSVHAGEQQMKEYDEYIEKCITTYNILIEREGEKAKAFDDINIKKFFKDCSVVVKKYENNEYTKKPVKGLKSLVKDAMLRGEPLLEAVLEIVNDYEKNCSK